MLILEGIYKRISQWLMVAGLMTCVLLLNKQGGLRAVSTAGALFSLGVGLYYSLLLFKALPGKVSLPYLSKGVCVILGGALLDITVTIWCSPDLSREGNPIALLLFDLNYRLWMVYLILFCVQVLMVGTTLSLWASFVKVYPQLIKAIPYKNLFTTCKWWLGSGQMSFKDFLLGRNINYCFTLSFSTFLLVLSQLNRFYLAMEWLDLVPMSRIVPGIIISFILFFFLIKSHNQIKTLSLIKANPESKTHPQ